jgi:hypothetical protein
MAAKAIANINRRKIRERSPEITKIVPNMSGRGR